MRVYTTNRVTEDLSSIWENLKDENVKCVYRIFEENTSSTWASRRHERRGNAWWVEEVTRDLLNYKQVSLTTVVCKLCEKVNTRWDTVS